MSKAWTGDFKWELTPISHPTNKNSVGLGF